MRILPDLPYGALPHQALDLALPDQPRALVVYLHGGGFVKGSRKEATFDILAKALGPQGVAVASVSYRLGGTLADLPPADRPVLRKMRADSAAAGLQLRPRLYGAAFAVALFDISLAVGQLREGAMAPALADVPITLLGMSAGGIAALSLAHPPPVWAWRLARPDAVLAVSAAMVQPWCIGPAGAPCVMLHGVTDRIIPPQDARLADRIAQDTGADLRLIVTDTAGHVPQLTRLLHGTAAYGVPELNLLTDLVARTVL